MRKTVVKILLAAVLGISGAFITGCWDRQELNDRAIVLGWGVDITKDGRYLATADIVIPGNSKAGGTAGGENSFLIESAYGKTITDAAQNMQKKLSRVIFPGHRRNIFIGEDLARHGIGEVLDEYVRNPLVRLRTNIFVVRGDSAQRTMSMAYKLERNPAIAVQKIQEKTGPPVARSLLDFFIMLNGEGKPTMPSIKIVPPIEPPDGKPKKSNSPVEVLQLDGSAVFGRDLKLKGYLDYQEYWIRMWMAQKLRTRVFTVQMKPKQSVVVRMEHLKSKITPDPRSDPIRFYVQLRGQAAVLENNTYLNMGEQKNVRIAEQALNDQIKEHAEEVIKKVQKQLKADILGFGDAIHHQHPYQWKKIKPVWEEEFVRSLIHVQVNVSIKSTGVTGPSLIPKPEPQDEGGS